MARRGEGDVIAASPTTTKAFLSAELQDERGHVVAVGQDLGAVHL